MASPRISAKAMIVRDGALLVLEHSDGEGIWYALPGGGQEFGERLEDAVQRECLEEVSATVRARRAVFIRDYIGKSHEFASSDGHIHQCEVVFDCELLGDYQPRGGHVQDKQQIGVRWLPLAELASARLYPKCFIEAILNYQKAPWHGAPYLGDRN